ncbi:uncharacterized protein LOC144542361 [Centroberyx gerrardi]
MYSHSLSFTIWMDSSICFFTGLADGCLWDLQEPPSYAAVSNLERNLSGSRRRLVSPWPSVASLSSELRIRDWAWWLSIPVCDLRLGPYTELGMGLALKTCRSSFGPRLPSSATIFASFFLLSLSRKLKGRCEAADKAWLPLLPPPCLPLLTPGR